MNQVDTAFRTNLLASPVLASFVGNRIFEGSAPEGTILPYVTYQKMSGVDFYTHDRASWRELVYMVKGITKRGTGDVGGKIADAINLALTDQPLMMEDWTSWRVFRNSDLYYIEPPVGGIQYEHNGGLYRTAVG